MSAYGAVEGKLGDTVAYYSSPRFLMGFGALVAAYRAFFLYGATRIVAWVIWVHTLQGEPWDLNWGDPYRVDPFEPW